MDCSYHMLHALIVEISSLFLGCGLYCSLGIMPRLSKLTPSRRRSPAPPRCTLPPASPPPREAEAAAWPDAEAWSEWRDQVGASPPHDKPPCPPCEKRVNGVLVEVNGVRVAQPPGSTQETFLSLERVSSTQATKAKLDFVFTLGFAAEDAKVTSTEVQDAVLVRHAAVYPYRGEKDGKDPFAVEANCTLSETCWFNMGDSKPRFIVGSLRRDSGGLTTLIAERIFLVEGLRMRSTITPEANGSCLRM